VALVLVHRMRCGRCCEGRRTGLLGALGEAAKVEDVAEEEADEGSRADDVASEDKERERRVLAQQLS